MLVPTAHPQAEVHTPQQGMPGPTVSPAYYPCTPSPPFPSQDKKQTEPPASLPNDQCFFISLHPYLLLLLISILLCPQVQPTLKPSKGPAFAPERQSPRAQLVSKRSVIYRGRCGHSRASCLPLGRGLQAREQGYVEKWKSAPTAADIMASRLRCSWTPKQ